jgi:hypothetical protein
MNSLLFIPLLFVCSMVIGQSSEIIGTPIKIGKLEVAKNDFPNTSKIIWSDAKNACASLGKGWRLPTKDELTLMFENKDKIGGFANTWYWSSTEHYISGTAWMVGFGKVVQYDYKDKFGYYTNVAVRAVRTIN